MEIIFCIVLFCGLLLMYSVRNRPSSMKWSCWSFVIIYAILVLLAVGVNFNIFNKHSSALSGVGLFFIGLPWSSIGIMFSGKNNEIAWIGIIGGIILNTAILSFVGEIIGRVEFVFGRGIVILILGIIGLIFGQILFSGLILGTLTWIMGYNTLNKIKLKAIPDAQKGITKLGMIIGVIAVFQYLSTIIQAYIYF